jgi:cytochrome P450
VKTAAVQGHETTSSLIANACLLLLDPAHAEQRVQLQADLAAGAEAKVDDALEEMLRHISPIKEMVSQGLPCHSIAPPFHFVLKEFLFHSS